MRLSLGELGFGVSNPKLPYKDLTISQVSQVAPPED